MRLLQVTANIASSLVFLSTQAAALSPPPPLLILQDISLDLAQQGADAALAACKEKAIHVVVEVADRNQNIRAFLVSDSTDLRAYDIARKNVYTVLNKGMSSRAYAASLSTEIIIDPQRDPDHKLGLSGGAVPILKTGAVVGVVSVSGGRTTSADGFQYEACATAGRDKIEAGLKAQKSN
ncbi:MAG TPA: heme-binding protein [Rhizomicrobium sp.]|nr:heme-binding protein [Rhizomicrobium sp.]